MTKEQCIALISAFQEASKYLAVIKLKNKRPSGATGYAVIEEISEQFDEEIQKIIDAIPEGGGGGGGGVDGTYTIYNMSTTSDDFNPVVIGNFDDGNSMFEFMFKADDLPNNTSKEWNLASMMEHYTITNFVSITGVTDGGHFVSNGRTDNQSNTVIAQQASKTNKKFTLRTYADLSTHFAILCIRFYGKKV